MNIYEGIDSFKKLNSAVVTSGTFDGVHIGHQEILSKIRQSADQLNGETVLITFWPHPRHILYPNDDSVRLLSTFEEKAELLEKYGIDHLVKIEFTPEFSQLSSNEFIQQVLIDKINTKRLVIGYNHRFGHNREGSFEHLKTNADKFGFEVEEISKQMVDHVGVSSTMIREALFSGEVDTAHSYLGRDYSIKGFVIKGKNIGNSIGYPTANINVPQKWKLIPGDGTYAVRIKIRQDFYSGMMNIGYRPTVNGKDRSIEVHIFDFDSNIYDQEIEIFFSKELRKERKFNNLDELRHQLSMDEKNARKILNA